MGTPIAFRSTLAGVHVDLLVSRAVVRERARELALPPTPLQVRDWLEHTAQPGSRGTAAAGERWLAHVGETVTAERVATLSGPLQTSDHA